MRALFCIVGLFVQFYALAGIETQVSYINGTAFLDYAIHGGSTVPNTFAYSELTDFNPPGNVDWENNYKIISSTGRVELYIDGSAQPLFFKYALEVPVEITYYKLDHTFTTLNHKFRVDYDPVEGSYHRQLDMWQLDGVFAINVRVKGNDPSIQFFADSPLTTGQKEDISKVVKIRVTKEYDKIVNFDYQRSLQWNEIFLSYDNTDNQLNVSWSVIEGAEVYDLEWGFIER
ncbi:MAG: hypothetical protein IPO65_07050 [Saprospiraceae bacterium]|nr:hypothetical protein [Saprospiraceae bacterium]